jgi:AraC-like DNA-binding protein
MKKERRVSPIVANAINIIKQYIEQHPLERIRIPDLTDMVCVGTNRLHGSFKEMEGKTIARFQLEKRMERAAIMLEESRLTVSEIAYRCGYREQANFTSDFKKVFHITPTEKMFGVIISNNHS